MKKTKRFLLIAIVVMMLSYSFTALAAGETLQHYGHSRVGYTSQESVSQRTDTLLLNQHWRSSANMAVSAVNSASSPVGPAKIIAYEGCSLTVYQLPATDPIRQVHIRVNNQMVIPSSQPAAYSEGNWILLP